jgi:hypothetical protein
MTATPNPMAAMASHLQGRCRRLEPAAHQGASKTDALRSTLRAYGRATSAELAQTHGLPNTARVGALLKGDLEIGRVEYSGGAYFWNAQFDESMRQEVKRAASLLRAQGYQVKKLRG